jgi:AcrR family transcriptional regulator
MDAVVDAAVLPDRRQRRRQQTIEEVLDVSVELMTEHGAAGLSLGDVARRMGMQTPSLYVYFPSKHALYDALFERGARLVLEHVDAKLPGVAAAETAEDVLLESARTFVRWCIDHPAYSQLLFWRPVPGFTPSPASYGPSLELMERTHALLGDLQRRRLLRDDVPVADLARDWTVLVAGVISQQMANAPDEPFDTGRFTAALPSLVAMFTARHGTTPAPPRRTQRGPRHGHPR